MLTSLCDVTPAVDGPDEARWKNAPLICQTGRLDVVCEGHWFIKPKDCFIVIKALSTRGENNPIL